MSFFSDIGNTGTSAPSKSSGGLGGFFADLGTLEAATGQSDDRNIFVENKRLRDTILSPSPVSLVRQFGDLKANDPTVDLAKILQDARKEAEKEIQKKRKADIDTRNEVISSFERNDPEEDRRNELRSIPIVGRFLFGTGENTIGHKLGSPDIVDLLKKEGISGFLFSGYTRYTTPTQVELATRIDKSYEVLIENGYNEKDAAGFAINNVVQNTPGAAQNIQDLYNLEFELSEEESDILFWTNQFEGVFATIDAPFFLGTGKPVKGGIHISEKLLQRLSKSSDFTRNLSDIRKLVLDEEKARLITKKVTKASNTSQVDKILRDFVINKKGNQNAGQIFSREVDDSLVTYVDNVRTVKKGGVVDDVADGKEIGQVAKKLSFRDDLEGTKIFLNQKNTEIIEQIKHGLLDEIDLVKTINQPDDIFIQIGRNKKDRLIFIKSSDKGISIAVVTKTDDGIATITQYDRLKDIGDATKTQRHLNSVLNRGESLYSTGRAAVPPSIGSNRVSANLSDVSEIDNVNKSDFNKPVKQPKIEQRAEDAIEGITSTDNIESLRVRTRDVISDADAMDTARTLGFNEDKIMAMPVGKILTKEEKFAVSGVVTDAVETLRAIERGLPEARLAPAVSKNREIIQNYALQKAKVMKLLAVERGIAAETGRALQAHKTIANAIQSEEKKIAKFLADPTNPQDAKDFIIDQMSRYGDNPEKMRELMRNLQNPTVMEMFVEFATAVKLYAIPTHLVNALTSIARVSVEIPLRGISAAWDSGIAKMTGRERTRFLNEVKTEAYGQWQGWKDAWRPALEALKNENYALEARKVKDFNPKGAAIRGRLGKNTLRDRFLNVFGKVVRLSFRALGVEDILIRSPAEMGAMYTFAGRSALQKGLKVGSTEYSEHVAKFVFEPDAEVIEAAIKAADKGLFQEQLPPFMEDLNKIRGNYPITKLIVPFFRTLNNLIKQSIEFSPLAPVLPSVRSALKTPGLQSDALAKMTLGVSVLVPLTAIALEDKITLGAPKNAGARDAFYATGRQPYSILIGDTWYQYSRFSPFAEWFITAGMIGEAVQNDNDSAISESLSSAFFTMTQNMLDKTFVTGISDLLDALTNPNKADRWLQNFVTGATIPTISGRAARAVDPTVREIDSLRDAYYSRIPGLSSKLPARTDVFGEDIVRPSGPIEQFISPVTTSPVQVNMVRDELEDIGYVLGFPGQSSLGYELNDEQYRTLKTISGKVIYATLFQVMQTSEYQDMPAQDKEQTVQRVVNKVRSKVKAKAFPEFSIMKHIEERLKERGLTDEDAKTKAPEIYKLMKESSISS